MQVRNQSLIAVRGHILRDDTPIEVLLEDYRKGKVDSMICKVPFKHEHGHLTEVVVGTIHLNNVYAKKPQAPVDLLTELLGRAVSLQTDLIGMDWNQGQRHVQSALEALGGGVLLLGSPSDCVGLILPPHSRLANLSCTCKYYVTPTTDLGWGRRDGDSHYLIAAHFRVAGEKRQRNPDTKREQRQRASVARKERRAQSADQTAAAVPGPLPKVAPGPLPKFAPGPLPKAAAAGALPKAAGGALPKAAPGKPS